MRCPVDATMLALAERAGVEIDHCPQCRGGWLYRGRFERPRRERAGAFTALSDLLGGGAD